MTWIKSRKTHGFVELSAEEIKVVAFKSDPSELKELIENLLDVVDDVAKYTGKSVHEWVEEQFGKK
jgi:hypothetical protein